MKLLFIRYGVASNRPTGGESSTGLGLFAIKQTLESYGSTIDVFSEGKGKGSRFTVTMDAAIPPKELDPNA